MKLAIVGATGLVGQTFLKVIKERKITFSELFLVASENSKGKKIVFQDKEYRVIGLDDALKLPLDVALFSAGGAVSKTYAPQFAANGVTVIDNSSAWRMDEDVPLVVSYVNGHVLDGQQKIIANPNCSTIQLVATIAPLHKQWQIQKMRVTTFQSYTGTGNQAVKQYEAERSGKTHENPAYPHPIYNNVIPHCGDFVHEGYTQEEMKITNETKKILQDDAMKISATAVRVPVDGGHSESVYLECAREVRVEDIKACIHAQNELTLEDDFNNLSYPMPIHVKNTDEIKVGRIRQDLDNNKGLWLWISADNLRIGAATNAIQILEFLMARNLL